MTGSAVNKTCFVIMPFGEKTDASGATIDFDVVYQHIIREAALKVGLSCLRCDQIAQAGWIHSKMFHHILHSDVAIVDITTLNPNVFYELGVRHALAESVTVLLRRKGTQIPFNVQDLHVIEYDHQDIANVEAVKSKIAEFIQNGLRLNQKDSPVHEVLSLRPVTEPKRLNKTVVIAYGLTKVPHKQICLITGDLNNVRNHGDVWVNSENTNMSMGRPNDRSISSVIRYLGAVKGVGNNITIDCVADELHGIVGSNANVAPGTVIPTTAGELEKVGVRRIFHAAAVVGQVGVGFKPIPDIGKCVRNSLDLAISTTFKDLGIKSILFPLLGCGNGGGSLDELVPKLLGSAIAYLEENPGCELEKIYFLAWSDRELATCQRFLDESTEIVSH